MILRRQPDELRLPERRLAQRQPVRHHQLAGRLDLELQLLKRHGVGQQLPDPLELRRVGRELGVQRCGLVERNYVLAVRHEHLRRDADLCLQCGR